jgi:Bacterial Ig-like domain
MFISTKKVDKAHFNVSLDAVNHRIVTIDPSSNLAAATSYTVTMTTNLRGLYGPWTVTPAASDSISFTTA